MPAFFIAVSPEIDKILCVTMKPIRAFILFIALTPALTSIALAQNASPVCDGNIATVRVSAIKPNAIDTFLAAVAAHKAWYLSHGLKDTIVAARVIMRDDKNGGSKYSDAEAMTYHVYPAGPRQPEAAHDDAYAAFVKLYNDSSEIKSEYRVCLPKLAQ